MKTLLLFIILTTIFLGFGLRPAHADSTEVQILDIHVEPSTLKVNDTFLISATILNSSPYPIYLTSGSCTPAFLVSFDIHAKQVYPNIACTTEAIIQKVDPLSETTISNANKPGIIYETVLAGTANANITIQYFAKNQTATDYSNIDYKISKSFQFTIRDNNLGKTMSYPVIHGTNSSNATNLEDPELNLLYHKSPLKQFNSGIAPKDVKCNDNLLLTFKAQDGSPACVKPETAKVLYERGWALVLVVNFNNSNSYQPVDVISILPDSFTTNPGGPAIKITLKNTGMTPITSLKAKLHLNNDYTFDFANVSQSEPLASGNLASDSKILIGAGFNTILGYPLTISGITNNIPFNFTVSVWISPTSENSVTENKTASGLKLYLATSSQTIRPGQDIDIIISVNNTLSKQITLSDENSWKLNYLSVNPCTSAPYGVAILDGFYSEQNVTEGKPLTIFNNAALCPAYNKTNQSYVFEPLSSHVALNNCTGSMSECSSGFDMGNQFSFSGIWKDGQIQSFTPGLYTIIGGDEWGHIAIEHFVVTNNTIFAGNLGSMSCPATYSGVQFTASMKNFTGFANYYNSSQYGQTFILHPGMKGTITVQYDAPANAAWFQNNDNTPFNMTNGAALFYAENVTKNKNTISYIASLYNDKTGHHSEICHYHMLYGGFEEPCNTDNSGDIPLAELPDASKVLHVGIDTYYAPNSVMLYPNTSSVFTALVSTNSDAMQGTYWLSLQWSLCGPGVLAKLVVLP